MFGTAFALLILAAPLALAMEEALPESPVPVESGASPARDQPEAPERVAPAQPFPLERYQPLLEGNPFTLIKPETDAAPDFARNLSIIGIMRTGGKTTALLFDSESRTRLTVGETPDPVTGIQIESVALAAKPDDVSIQLAKGSERGTVRFNRDAMALAAGGGGAPVPGGPAAATGAGPRPPNANPATGQNIPQPRIIRRPIRRAEPIPGQ